MEQITSSPSVTSDDECDRFIELIVEHQETKDQLVELECQIQEAENSLQDKT